MSAKPIVSVTTPTGQLVDSKGGATFALLKWMQNIGDLLNKVFDQQASLTPQAIPPPTTSTLGGVFSGGPVSKQWVSAIDSTGAPRFSQPGFSDLSGSAQATQIPALSDLSGSVSASQVPALSALNGAVAPAQVPSLDQLNGRITQAQLPAGFVGIDATIATAKLTVGGTNGSMTFVAGILQSQVQAT